MKNMRIEIYHKKFWYMGYLLRSMFPEAEIETNPPLGGFRPVIVDVTGDDANAVIGTTLYALVYHTKKDEYRDLPKTCETVEFILFCIAEGL